MRKITTLVFATVLLFISTAVWGQANIQSGSSYVQNFDNIGIEATASLPAGWKTEKNSTVRSVVNAYNELTTTSTERSNAYNIALSSSAGNGIYNYGGTIENDRAIGGLSSSSASKSVNMYLQLTNNGTSTIKSLNINYAAERYRNGTNPAGFSIRLFYSTTGAANSWTEVSSAIASFTLNADNNGSITNPTETISINSKTVNADIAPQSSIYLCWNYSVTSGTTTSNAQAIGIDNIVIAAKNTASAADPIFTIATGNYLTNQSVEISTSTSGADIHYTTDGSEPTASSTMYTTPIAVSTTTTIKAIAIKSGMEASSVSSATYTFPTEVANIAALRALTLPAFAKLTGEAVLTLKSVTRNAKYIQDATAAILIDDANGVITTTYNLGDGITGIIGTLANFSAMLQFTPATNPGAPTSTGNNVTPTVVSLEDLSLHPAKLVKVKGVTIDATGNFANSTTYKFVGYTTSPVLKTQYIDLDYVSNTMAIPSGAKDITGVVLVNNSVMQLVPRSSADFAISTSTTNPTTNSGIYTVDGKIALTAEAGQLIEVYNAVGQRLVAVKANEGLNKIAVSAKGVVVVRTAGKLAKVIL